MKNSFVLILFISATTILNSHAQNLVPNNEICTSCGKHLSLKFENSNFIKNNEYSGSFTEGFTGIGNFIKPTLSYYLSSNTRIDVGGYFLKYYGQSGFDQVAPVLSIRHKLNDQVDLILGTLKGSLAHGLEEPLYRFDTYYQDQLENGIQVLINNQWLESDTWIDWQRFITPGDTFQESFQFGSTNKIKLKEDENSEISIPIQVMIHHLGGQIDNSPDPVSTIANGVIGLTYDIPLKNGHHFIIEPLMFNHLGPNLDQGLANAQLFDKGTATYLKAKYLMEDFDFMVGYWRSKNFIVPSNGEYLFLNISEQYKNYSEFERKLINLKASYTKEFSESVSFSFRTDGYFDILNGQFNYSYGLYLVINESIFLKKLRTN